MSQRHGGFRSKTRHKLQKSYKDKGKLSITRFFQKFEEGESVILKADPAYHKGMYYPRFHGKTGVISGMKGECYLIAIKDSNKEKELIVHPVHLRRA